MKIDLVIDEGMNNEDLHLIGRNIYGVFDGFNSLDKYVDKYGKTGGQIAAMIARDEFHKNDRSLKDLAREANRKIRERMVEYNVDTSKKGSLWGTIFAVGRIIDKSFEWMQIGDSLILVVYKDNSFKLLVNDYNHDKELLETWKELAERKKENIRELIKGPHLELRNKMNETYGCLTGEQKAISFLKSGRENLENVKAILFFTDGLFIPKEDPTEDDDWAKFVELYLRGGLKSIRDFVRNLEKKDPKCWKYPRFKQYDDIAAISISLQIR